MPSKRDPDTAERLLTLLGRTYDFGPALNKRIDATLVLHRIKLKAPDPLLDPPGFLRGRFYEEPGRRAQEVIINLGIFNGYSLRIVHHEGAKDTALCWGCAVERSYARACWHWRSDWSRVSNEYRPNADAMIEWVAAVCKHRGWAW